MSSKFFKFFPYYHIFVSVGNLKYTTTVDLSLVFFRSLKKEIMGSSFLEKEPCLKSIIIGAYTIFDRIWLWIMKDFAWRTSVKTLLRFASNINSFNFHSSTKVLLTH